MYTKIIHSIRDALKITTNEYCVLDMVYHLSNNKKHSGWAFASRQYIGDCIGVSKRSAINLIEALIKKKLLIRDEKTKHLKVVESYSKLIKEYNSKLKKGEDNSPDWGRKFTKSGEKSYPYKDIHKHPINNGLKFFN